MSIATDMLESDPKTDAARALLIAKVERLAEQFMEASLHLAILYGPKQASEIVKKALWNASYWNDIGNEAESCIQTIPQEKGQTYE